MSTSLTNPLIGLAMLLLAGCAPLPDLSDRPASQMVHDTADTRLGRAIEPVARAHPGASGIAPLLRGGDAFAARSLLARAAERTLDVQYYIWHDDLSGTLLFDALYRAAERGVRVRLLLDDNNTAGLDPLLAALDAHPHIEVRLFNPFRQRDWRVLGYLTDFARVNRRMHNKSFTADNQATVIGGRNVGDEYFAAAQDALFVDLDVLAVGPVVEDVSRDFDRYWASGSSYPVARLLPPAPPDALHAFGLAAEQARHAPAAASYLEALAREPFVRDLLAGELAFEWAPTRLVSDDPAKGLGRAEVGSLLPQRLDELLDRPQDSLRLVSAYFVPTRVGVDAFTALAERGVSVAVLTNAFEATDVAVVHAGYAKWRKPLLAAGVRLFEMKRAAAPVQPHDRGLTSSSASSLHAKTFSVDGARLFIGSFNFDPRSARLNTEMGFVIDSPTLAAAVTDAFAERMPAWAFEVRLDASGELEWLESSAAGERVHEDEPGTTAWQRAAVSLLAQLPIDWLL